MTTAAILLLALLHQDKSSDQLLADADKLMAEARALYDTGKAGGALADVVDAGFKADEARAKYQAVQQITSGENQRKAAAGVREANQLIKLVNDARVALKKPPAVPAPDPSPGAPKPAMPAPAPPPPPPAPAVPVPDKKPAVPGIDLLKLVKADLDVVHGGWLVQPGKLLLAQKRAKDGGIPRVELPYLPPEEYDLRVTFRHTGNGEVWILLSKDGHPFAFELGGAANTVFSLKNVKEPPGDPATTTIRKAKCLEGARSYQAVVEVRSDGIRAYLDELLIVYASITGPGDLSIPAELALRRPDLLGIAAGNQSVVSSVEIVEIKGKGRPAR